MTKKLSLQTALYQMDSIWKAPEQNVDQLANHMQALPSSIDLLVLPEMWTTGFVMDPTEAAVSMDHPVLGRIAALVERYGIDIVGSMAIAAADKYYNRALLHSREGLVHTYDKQYLFSLSKEGDAYTQGYAGSTFDYKGWNVQLQICYDLRFPESNTSAVQPDLIIYMANWPAARIYHWQQLLVARAIENQCYVIGCNRTGTDGNGWTFPGQSQVVDYAGVVLDVLDQDSSGSVVTLHREDQEAYRAKFPFYQDKK